jgi:hypothetical protein
MLDYHAFLRNARNDKPGLIYNGGTFFYIIDNIKTIFFSKIRSNYGYTNADQYVSFGIACG